MELAEKNRRESLDLNNFSSSELYYLVSNVLGLGDFYGDLLSRERLLIKKADYDDRILFFFTSTLPLLSEHDSEPMTTFALGHFSNDLEDVFFKKGVTSIQNLDASQSKINCEQILKLNFSTDLHINLENLIKGVEKLRKKSDSSTISVMDFADPSQSFDEGYFQNLDFGLIDGINFSGNYLLIAEPEKEKEAIDMGIVRVRTIIHEFFLLNTDEVGGYEDEFYIIDYSHRIGNTEFEAFQNDKVGSFIDDEDYHLWNKAARRLLFYLWKLSSDEFEMLAEKKSMGKFIADLSNMFMEDYRYCIEKGISSTDAIKKSAKRLQAELDMSSIEFNF